MAKKASNTTTKFPTMGTSAGNLGSVAKPVKGKSVPKTGNSKGGMLEAATAAHKANINERLGSKLAPQVALYAPNAAEAAETQRNTVLVPSAIGNRDFYLRRQYGQGI